jgi:hypothetical protein
VPPVGDDAGLAWLGGCARWTVVERERAAS